MKSIIRKIYAYRALEDFILLYPLYSVMFAERGLSTFQISILFILWSTVSIVAEVPSGVLADKYSRKNLLGYAQLIRAVGYLFWLIMPDFIGFGIGFALWGFSGALTSGTFEALVFDELKAVGQENTYVRVMGRAGSYALVADFLATALAAAAIVLGYNFVIWASIVAVVISAVVAFTLPETQRTEEAADREYFTMLKSGIKQAVHTPAILKIMLLSGFAGCVYGTLEEYVPLLVRDTGAGHSLISIVVAITVVAAAAGSFIAHRYEKMSNAALMMLLAGSGVALVVAASVAGFGSWSLIVGYTFVIQLVHVVFGGRLQHAITDGTLRATVTSVDAFITEVLAIAMYFGFGLIATTAGNVGAFKFFGATIIMVALVYILIAPRMASTNRAVKLTN